MIPLTIKPTIIAIIIPDIGYENIIAKTTSTNGREAATAVITIPPLANNKPKK
ncbi:hypothetical protein MYP_2491 [Sporocytophaga myxococcoides]|uniref:Uncharacterized protein n=1 Tax=Sporocytophaga myxococcoides TaxID=153721 RepID=A0A098LGW7_9BACT|nr:hypothetical protein MYP_2491 [Sporocytophaga myxococcoides]